MLDNKEVDAWLKGEGPLPKHIYDPDDQALEVHCFGYKRKKKRMEKEKARMNNESLNTKNEKDVSDFLTSWQENAASQSDRLTASSQEFLFQRRTEDNRQKVTQIIDQHFDELSEDMSELTQNGRFSTIDLLYLLEKTRVKILTQLINMEFITPTVAPIQPAPVYPYAPQRFNEPTVAKPEWVYEWTDRTTKKEDLK